VSVEGEEESERSRPGERSYPVIFVKRERSNYL
jgi:hypothetical protein